MTVLALETTSTSGGVAIAAAGAIRAAALLDIRVTHSERLMPQIDSLLDQAGMTIDDIDMVAVSNGPGSFTGVRIGLATAKGICEAKQIPLWPVHSLDLLAHNAYGAGLPVLACIDARMDEVYAALYAPDLTPIIEPRNALPDEFFADIAVPAVLAIGSGAVLYREKLDALLCEVSYGLPHMNAPQAVVLASMAMTLPAPPAFDWEALAALEPFYLRRSQAELMADEREKKNQ